MSGPHQTERIPPDVLLTLKAQERLIERLISTRAEHLIKQLPQDIAVAQARLSELEQQLAQREALQRQIRDRVLLERLLQDVPHRAELVESRATAQTIVRQAQFREHFCALAQRAGDDAFEYAKIGASVIATLVASGLVPPVPVAMLAAAIGLAVYRLGITWVCRDSTSVARPVSTTQQDVGRRADT